MRRSQRVRPADVGLHAAEQRKSRRSRAAKVAAGATTAPAIETGGIAASVANNHDDAWREDLFRAICADHAASVKRLLREQGMLEDGRADEKIFGVMCEVDRRRGSKKRLFIGYGAHAKDCHSNGFVRHGATCLHVAVWKDSQRVARLLSSLGASTGKEDACGCSAFGRANTRAMQSVLCRPAAPRDLVVISCERGRAVLQWTASRSKPKIGIFEIREENTNQKWILDASSKDVSRFALTEDRDGPSACIFETPVGSVESGLTYKFAARSRNEDGYWSDWCSTDTAVKSKHWIADWKDEDVDSRVENSLKFKSESVSKSHDTFLTHQKTQHQHQQGYLEGRGTSSETKDGTTTNTNQNNNNSKNKKKELLLGSRNFGLVRDKDWLRSALEQQRIAATTIQSLIRAFRQRKRYVDLAWVQRRALRRTGAARILQRFYRECVSELAQRERQAQQAQARARARSSSISAHHLAVQSAVVPASAKASLRSAQHQQRLAMENAIRRESERLQFLKESGCDFMATLPDPWH